MVQFKRSSRGGELQRIQIGQYAREEDGFAMVEFLRKHNVDVAKTVVDQSLREAVAEVQKQVKKAKPS